MNKANLTANIGNLSATYSQKHRELFANSSPECPINTSNPDTADLELDGSSRLENYLNIEVKGISVRAINSVEGGSASATSNIIIEPVQIIKVASQAAEKLR